MAKLTEAQKAANRADRKVREAGFKARKLYQAALKASDDEHLKSPEYAATKEVNAAYSALMNERDERQAVIRDKIQALQKDLNALTKEYGDRMESVSAARRLANLADSQARQDRSAKVDALFPDVVKAYSPAGWKPDLIPKI